jgi:hypothetical protein
MIDLDKIKLGIALPNTSETYPSKFVDSFCAITKPKHLYIRPSSQGPIDTVRNDLVLLALMNECTHIWMADTDQVYPQDVLMRMLEHDKDIIAAKVHRRRPPYDPILYRGTLDNFTNVPDEEWSKGGLIEVDATGFGSVLIKMTVFESIERPWFVFDLHNHQEPVGEDIGFYVKARKEGFRVWVDCSIKIGHLATMVITEESYLAFKQGTLKSSEWDRESGHIPEKVI